MYLIINMTTDMIIIGDLGIELGPKKAIDLDKVFQDRSKFEHSKDLKYAEKSRKIQIRHDRVVNKERETVTVTQKIDDEHIMKIREAVRQEVVEQIKNISSTPDNQIEIILEQMRNMIERGSSLKENSVNESVVQDNYNDIDLDKLSEIHAKSVKKISKNTEGNVRYEEHKSSSSLDNLDELDGLLD